MKTENEGGNIKKESIVPSTFRTCIHRCV